LQCDENTEFNCKDETQYIANTCILKKYVCDSINDCANNRDEKICTDLDSRNKSVQCKIPQQLIKYNYSQDYQKCISELLDQNYYINLKLVPHESRNIFKRSVYDMVTCQGGPELIPETMQMFKACMSDFYFGLVENTERININFNSKNGNQNTQSSNNEQQSTLDDMYLL